MKNIIFVLALVYLITSTVIRQTDKQLLSSLNPYQYIHQLADPYNVKINQAPDAIWIQTKNQYSSPNTITENFYASCLSNMTIYVAADKNFTIIINAKVLNYSESNHQIIHCIEFEPKCGNNTFSITVGSSKIPAAMIYAIVQNTRSCYSCPFYKTWNTSTCSCECRDNCGCRKNQFRIDLPQCSVCYKKKQCDENFYYDQSTCSCKCLPKICRFGFKFDQNLYSCVRCIQYRCEELSSHRMLLWNPVLCACIEVHPHEPHFPVKLIYFQKQKNDYNLRIFL